MYASFRVSDFYQTYLYYPCKLRGYLTTFFGHEKTGFTLELCYSESTDPVAVYLSDLNAGYMMYPLIIRTNATTPVEDSDRLSGLAKPWLSGANI